MKKNKLLVVVDESPATKKALEYVARIVARRTNFQICLAHSVMAPPRELIEFRGPEKRRLRAYKSRWIAASQMTEQRTLERANAVLRRNGIARGAMEAHYCYLVDGTHATNAILDLARTQKCDTLVIGRKSLTWLRELIDEDPAEELVRRGKGLTIWVVG